jgi:hypothetical protein
VVEVNTSVKSGEKVVHDVILQCSCSYLGHSVRFSFWPRNKNWEPFEAFVDVMLTSEPSFWKRLRTAWRYLTQNTCAYGTCSECDVRNQDLPKLRAWLELAEAEATKEANGHG